MANFTTPVQIINRGIQRLGGDRISGLTDTSKEAVEAVACYDNLRRWELRRNLWTFSIRRTVLRALGTPLPAWDSTVTYAVGSLVTYNTINYISLQAANLNQNPVTATTFWSVFTGLTSQKLSFSAWAVGTTYNPGEIVTGSDNRLYLSLASANLGYDPTTDIGVFWQLYFGNYIASAYDSATTYYAGELVFDTSNLAYYSTINNNDNVPSTGTGWMALSCTVSAILFIPWPVGTGPASDPSTRNLYVLPYGFLREAPQDPRAGDYSSLGFPTNLPRTDWVMEGGFMVSGDAGPIMFRYAADISQVSLMDDMFCEMLGNRIAYELCETLTNSNTKQTAIGQEYTAFRSQAAVVNGIEQGSVNPPLDDWLAVRA